MRGSRVRPASAEVSSVRSIARLASALASAASVDDVVKVSLAYAVGGLGADEVTMCLPERRLGGWRVATRRRNDAVTADEDRLPLIWSLLGADTDVDGSLAAAAESGTASVRDGSRVLLPLTGVGVSGAVALTLPGASREDLEMAVLASFHELAGEALARARLYDAERHTANLLQRTLLPELLPHQRGVSLAVRYQPVTTGTAAGGDFYDVFELSEDRLALVIGDVVGRGVAAATVMGQVRSAARGAALTSADPAHVFSSLDRLVASLDETSALRLGAQAHRSQDPLTIGVRGELFVTMLYCVLDQAQGTLTVASAGHFPPVLIRGGGSGRAEHGAVAFADVVIGPPLGVAGERPSHTSGLGAGDALLAFTDGLLERRDRSLVDGEQVLLKALSQLRSLDPRSICQRVIDILVGGQQLEDDCALLALLRTEQVHRTASAVVPPLAAAVRRTRAWVEEQLQEWGAGVELTWVATMGVSELVTNVLLHAATDARVTLDLSPQRLLVTVSDAGTGEGPASTGGGESDTRGRGLGLVSAIAHSSGVERNVVGATVWFEVLVE